MSQVNIDLEEYDFSVYPPRLRFNTRPQNLDTASSIEPRASPQLGMINQSSTGYTYTTDSHVASTERSISDKTVTFNFSATDNMDSTAASGGSRYENSREPSVRPTEPNISPIHGHLRDTDVYSGQFPNVNSPARAQLPHSIPGAPEYAEGSSIDFSRNRVSDTTINGSFRTPERGERAQNNYSPY